ncbi:unnamed protein product [Trypanosoma congolense IL3000]|uniref:WGS project CAEQ00000000 data, annotated contig 1768 n=1 Tax=Trypanosoma congolense (strain IL3000) TaxID=1068625 RepID=F9W8R6_TRYCI|nr:unnamed protein product [Trypanosoma congolense IL3000]
MHRSVVSVSTRPALPHRQTCKIRRYVNGSVVGHKDRHTSGEGKKNIHLDGSKQKEKEKRTKEGNGAENAGRAKYIHLTRETSKEENKCARRRTGSKNPLIASWRAPPTHSLTCLPCWLKEEGGRQQRFRRKQSNFKRERRGKKGIAKVVGRRKKRKKHKTVASPTGAGAHNPVHASLHICA